MTEQKSFNVVSVPLIHYSYAAVSLNHNYFCSEMFNGCGALTCNVLGQEQLGVEMVEVAAVASEPLLNLDC